MEQVKKHEKRYNNTALNKFKKWDAELVKKNNK